MISTMPTMRLSLRLLMRDWRSGELAVLVAALVVAVTALTAVAFLTNRAQQAVELRAAASLAADLRLFSRREQPDSQLQLAQQHGLATARLDSLPSVVFAGEANSLAAVHAASAGYPLRGRLKTAPRLLGEASETRELPAPGEAWAAPTLLARLGVDTGTEIDVGHARLRITRVLTFRPDEGWSFTDLAPTLLINHADLAATGLIQPGSRVSYRQLFAGDAAALKVFRPLLEAQLLSTDDLDDIDDSSPQIRSAMDRAGRFLNLASLVSVLLSAIAVAMAARRYAHRHRDRVALMKCLGAPQALVFRTSAWQLLWLAIAGALLGILLGFLGQQGLAFLLRDFIGEELPLPGIAPAWLGLVTALSILGGFALPDLLQMGRTPPLRVLRQDIDPPPLRYGAGWLAAVLAVLFLLGWMVRDAALVGSVALGSAVTFGALGLAGWALVRALQRFRGAAGVAWRFGLANVARRGRESVVQVVAFGLGIMVLLVLSLVRNDLMNTWRASLPSDAPNRFMINIQANEVEPIRAFMAERGITMPRFVPMVRARLTQLNGKDITQLTFEDPQGERWARREANLSYTDVLQEDNRITAGAWWAADDPAPQVSVEEDFAKELGLKLGDRLAFDVAGEALEVTVSSIRTVAWDSFRPNFFMVMNPVALKDHPGTHINSVFLQPGQESATIELMRAFPSVTVIDLDAALGQVRDVMDKAALAVQAVFVFTLLAGLSVLWAAVQSTRDERRFEAALLRSLGASRRRVLGGVLTEFLAIGLLAGLLATAGATLAAYLLATRLYELDYQFNLALTLAGPLLGMAFVGAAGWFATRRVVAASPMNVLRAA